MVEGGVAGFEVVFLEAAVGDGAEGGGVGAGDAVAGAAAFESVFVALAILLETARFAAIARYWCPFIVVFTHATLEGHWILLSYCLFGLTNLFLKMCSIVAVHTVAAMAVASVRKALAVQLQTSRLLAAATMAGLGRFPLFSLEAVLRLLLPGQGSRNRLCAFDAVEVADGDLHRVDSLWHGMGLSRPFRCQTQLAAGISTRVGAEAGVKAGRVAHRSQHRGFSIASHMQTHKLGVALSWMHVLLRGHRCAVIIVVFQVGPLIVLQRGVHGQWGLLVLRGSDLGRGHQGPIGVAMFEQLFGI